MKVKRYPIVDANARTAAPAVVNVSKSNGQVLPVFGKQKKDPNNLRKSDISSILLFINPVPLFTM
jgi:hypothetical protein